MFTVPVSILSITNYFVAQPSAGGKFTVNFSSLFLYNEREGKKYLRFPSGYCGAKGCVTPWKKNATWFLNSFEDLLKVLSEDWYRIMDLVLESNYLEARERAFCSPWDSRGDGNQSDNCYSSWPPVITTHHRCPALSLSYQMLTFTRPEEINVLLFD